MAIAMPPRDMMLEVMPICFMVMKAISTAMGSVRTMTIALGKCRRNTSITRETITDSSVNARFKVCTARSIRSERS